VDPKISIPYPASPLNRRPKIKKKSPPLAQKIGPYLNKK